MQDDQVESVSSALGKLRSGSDVDEIIRDLREAGLSVIDCLEVLCDSGRFSADEAKDIVFNSEAWADKKEAHDAFHEALIREVVDAMGTAHKGPYDN